MTLDRRTFIKETAASGAALTAIGTVTAGDGDRFIVAGNRNVAERIERAGATVGHELADGNVAIVTADDESSLRDVSGVSGVTRDVRLAFESPAETAPLQADETTDEPLYDLQWDKQITDVAEAYERSTGEGTAIAVIDTGCDLDHPDLAANVQDDDGRLFRESEVLAGEGEVQVPTEGGTETEVRHVADDLHGHGSHVAGIAAGARNDIGIVGTAPDADIVPLRVFYYVEGEDDGGNPTAVLTTTTADILLAIDYASAIGTDAMNMSIGTDPLPPQLNRDGFRQAYREVINTANNRGTVVTVSAGNSDTSLQEEGYFTTPNSVNGAVSVSATGPNDERTFYSNYGTNEIDVGAPGGGYETLEKTYDDDTAWPYPTNLVLSSVPPEFYGGETHAYFAGTSMAAPQVAGVAALVAAADPQLNVSQIENAIQRGATGPAGKGDEEVGAGILNADGALDVASREN